MNWPIQVVNIIKKHSAKQSKAVKQEMNRDTPAEKLSKEQTEILLKEYELCTNDANHLEDSIWTATSILLAATGAGLGLLGSSNPGNIYNLIVDAGISIFSLLIVHIWYRIVFRWHNIQGQIYRRSEKIEEVLQHMRKNLEIRAWLDKNKQDKKKDSSVSQSFNRVRCILIGVWLLFPLVQIAWYFCQVTGLSHTIPLLSIK